MADSDNMHFPSNLKFTLNKTPIFSPPTLEEK